MKRQSAGASAARVSKGSTGQRSGIVLAAAVAASAAWLQPAQAVDVTWTGGSAVDDNWTSADNWGGAAPIANDALIFDGGLRLTPNNDFAPLTQFNGLTFSSGAGAFTLGGNQISLLGPITNNATNVQTVNLAIDLAADTTANVAAGSTLNLNGVVSGAFGVNVTGGGTLSFGAANTYTGATTLDGGTVNYTADNTVGAVFFGAPPTAAVPPVHSTSVSALDLSSANLTATNITARTNNATPNTINIGAGRTLTVTNGMTVGGYNPLDATHQTRLTVTGNKLVVSGGTISLGGNSSGTNGLTGHLDLSGLAEFTFTGTELNLGGRQASNSGNRSAGNLTLANTANTITVTTVNVGAGSQNNGGGMNNLLFGGGTNVVNATTINIGTHKSPANVAFSGATGTLKIRGLGGTDADRANITLASRGQSGTATAADVVNFNGHAVDVMAGTIIIGQSTNSSTETGTLSFDTGTIDVNQLNLAVRTNGGAIGTMNVGGTAALNVNTGISLADGAGGTVTGTLNLNGGTTTLATGANITRTGATGTGTLNLAGGTLNMGGNHIGNTGTVVFNATAGTLKNVASINGAGGLTKSGTGTLFIDGANTWAGDTAVTGGTLAVVSATPTGGNVLVTSGTLAGNGDGTTTGLAGNVSVSGGGSIRPGTVNGDVGKLTMSSLNLNSGALSIDLGAGFTSDLVNVTGNLLIGDSPSAALTLNLGGANPAAGTYELINYGGTLTKNADFTISGPLGFNYALDYATANKVLLNVTQAANVLIWNGAADLTTWDFGAANFTNGTSNVAFTNGIDVGFTDTAPGTATTVTVAADVEPGIVAVESSTNNYTFQGTSAITGAASLKKTGTSTLTILNNNTYTGATTILEGTINVGNGGTSGSLGSGDVANNGTLRYNRSDAVTVANNIGGSGVLEQVGAGTLTLTGTNTPGATTIGAGSTLQVGAGGTTGSIGSSAVANAGALVFNRSDASTADGVISGAGAVLQVGSGATTLSAANSYTGVTTITGGALVATTLANGGAASSIGSSANAAANLVIEGGTLRWAGGGDQSTNRNFTMGAAGATLDASPTAGQAAINFNGTGTVALSGTGARTLTLAGTDLNPLLIDTQSISLIVADQDASNPTSVTKVGNNRWQFTGANTYTGGTTINAGGIRIGNIAGFGTGPVTVANGAQAYINVAGIVANNFSIAGDGPDEQPGAGDPIAGFGALRLANAGANVTGTVTLTAKARITGRSAGAGGTISGKITGPHALEFGNTGAGSGNVILSNSTNDWTGDTIVSHGGLKGGAVNVIPSGAGKGNVVVTNTSATLDSTFDLNAFDQTINGLASAGADLTRAKVVNNGIGGATLTVGAGDASGTFGGAIDNGTGGIAMVKTGAGTQALTGTNTYAGFTTVNAGTLSVTPSAIPTGNTVIVNGGSYTMTGAAGSVFRPGALTVNAGQAEVATNGGNVLAVVNSNFTLGAAGKLRMNDNDLIVDYTGASPEGQIRQYVKDGRANAASGIFATPGNPDDDVVLAVADNAAWGKTIFNNVNIDTDTVVGKYTYFGDANLDGKVTGDDYLNVDANLGTGDSWLEGDFNMSGVTTGDDYLAIDANLGKGTANPLAFAELKEEMVAAHVAMFGEEYLVKLAQVEAEGFGASVVPEPAAISLIGLGALGLLGRRRRRDSLIH